MKCSVLPSVNGSNLYFPRSTCTRTGRQGDDRGSWLITGKKIGIAMGQGLGELHFSRHGQPAPKMLERNKSMQQQ